MVICEKMSYTLLSSTMIRALGTPDGILGMMKMTIEARGANDHRDMQSNTWAWLVTDEEAEKDKGTGTGEMNGKGGIQPS
jgi:hypothetical protein